MARNKMAETEALTVYGFGEKEIVSTSVVARDTHFE